MRPGPPIPRGIERRTPDELELPALSDGRGRVTATATRRNRRLTVTACCSRRPSRGLTRSNRHLGQAQSARVGPDARIVELRVERRKVNDKGTLGHAASFEIPPA